MISHLTTSIQVEETINFLKKNLQIKEIYEKIIYQKIINQAAQERSLSVTDEEIQSESDRQRRENRLERAADTLNWLHEQMITPDDWEAGIRDNLLTKKLAESLFAKDIEKFFVENKTNFDRVVLYQIIITQFKLAQEIFYQIAEEEMSYYQAAHLYDINEQRRLLCGYEGKLYRWSLNPDLAATIFSAAPLEIIGPVKTEQGYHLLMVEEFIPAELTPDTQQEIIDKMFQEWLKSEFNHLIHNSGMISNETEQKY